VFTYGVTNSGTSYSVLQVGCPCESWNERFAGWLLVEGE
jgi:hypothetical protein